MSTQQRQPTSGSADSGDSFHVHVPVRDQPRGVLFEEYSVDVTKFMDFFLLCPTAGSATVSGYDVASQQDEVPQSIWCRVAVWSARVTAISPAS